MTSKCHTFRLIEAKWHTIHLLTHLKVLHQSPNPSFPLCVFCLLHESLFAWWLTPDRRKNKSRNPRKFSLERNFSVENSLLKCISSNICCPCQTLKKQVYKVEILLTAISLSLALHLTGNESFSKLWHCCCWRALQFWTRYFTIHRPLNCCF